MAFRPRLPVEPPVADWNAARLTHTRLVALGAAGRLAKGSPTRLIRSKVSPSPLAATPARNRIGRPVWAVASVLICQPCVSGFQCDVKDGTEYETNAVTMCRVSKSDGPRSSATRL